MEKIITTGTFDILHAGHINLLKYSRARGDYLVVGLNLSPEKHPYYSYEERKFMLEAIKYVSEVVPIVNQTDKLKYITDLNISEFVAGEEYRGFRDIPDIEALCPVIFAPRTPGISTTEIKQHLSIDTKYKTLVVDIDDTILTVKNRDFINAEPIQPVIDKLNELHDAGFKIIFNTARGMNSTGNNPEAAEQKYRAITVSWLEAHGVSYDELHFGKPNADAYIDDKAMTPEVFVRSLWKK